MNVQVDPSTLPAIVPPRREVRVVTDLEPILDTARFEHMQRIANVMARCALVPEALRGGDVETGMANCFLVVNQSVRWGMDPFAVAQCASVIHGKLCYEGKLVAAVMQKAGVNLSFKLNDKTGDAMGVTIIGTLPGENEPRIVTGTVGAWKTGNEQWKKDPAAMLCYRGARAWSRIHNPAPMLGVYTPDELEDIGDDARSRRARDVTVRDDGPPAPAAVARIEHKPQEIEAPKVVDMPQNGFDEAQWLTDVDGAFGGCETLAQFSEQQRQVMAPGKKYVCTETWDQAQMLAEQTYHRVKDN